MGLLSDIFGSISGNQGSQLFDNGDQQGALGKFGAGMRALAVDPSLAAKQNTPSDIQSYVYYSGLTPEQKAEFLRVKRADMLLNQGNQFSVLNPVTQQPNVVAPINPKVSEMPDFQAEQARRKAIGEGVGTSQANIEKKSVNAPEIINLVGEAEKLLPQATSGLGGRISTGTSKRLGNSTAASKADARLKVISGALTANSPRFEGPQGVLDVELYKQMAGDVANPEVPYEDRIAALKTIRDLQAKYLPQGAEQVSAPSQAVAATPDYSKLSTEELQRLRAALLKGK